MKQIIQKSKNINSQSNSEEMLRYMINTYIDYRYGNIDPAFRGEDIREEVMNDIITATGMTKEYFLALGVDSFAQKLSEKFIKFTSGKEMYEFIAKGNDLYNKNLGIYIFEYNDSHALCYYRLSPNEVISILKEKEKTNEYWGAYLGCGGCILDDANYDDQEHRYSEDENVRALYLKPSFDFCEDIYQTEGWMNTEDVTQEYVNK